MINDVETGACRHHPDLQPQRFSASKTTVVAAVEAVVRRQKRWRRLNLDLSTSTLTAVAVTKRVRFRDDVTIRVEQDGDEVVVNMRSKSRLGKSDFGVNAKRIRAFQAALAAELGGRS